MKVLDSVDYYDPKKLVKIEGLEQVLNQEQIDEVLSAVGAASVLESHNCETFFTATGFNSNIPQGLTMDGRFPETTDYWYESADNSNGMFV